MKPSAFTLLVSPVNCRRTAKSNSHRAAGRPGQNQLKSSDAGANLHQSPVSSHAGQTYCWPRQMRVQSYMLDRHMRSTVRNTLPLREGAAHSSIPNYRQWSQVSLNGRTITLHRTKAERTRHVPLNSIALAALESLKPQGTLSGPVFRNTQDNPYRAMCDWFEPAVRKAGLKDHTWHCNCHMFAPRLVMAGCGY